MMRTQRGAPLAGLAGIAGLVAAVALIVPTAASAFSNGEVCNYTQATAPVAAFTFSPRSPATGDSVGFDAGPSTAGTAHVWKWVSADSACEASGGIVSDPISSYAWSFGDGATGTGQTTSHTYSASGAYTAKLTVTESICHITPVHTLTCFTSSVTSSVAVANRPPTAAFTVTPASVTAGASVSFDASGSADADGTIVGYHWSFGDGQSQDTTTPVIAHVYSTAGTKTVTLTVTDNSGSTGQVQHAINVQPAPGTTGAGATPGANTGAGGGTARGHRRSARCVVPKLRGDRLAKARRILARHHCRLGRVRHRHVRAHNRGRVVAQSVRPGRHLKRRHAIGVTVGR